MTLPRRLKATTAPQALACCGRLLSTFRPCGSTTILPRMPLTTMIRHISSLQLSMALRSLTVTGTCLLCSQTQASIALPLPSTQDYDYPGSNLIGEASQLGKGKLIDQSATLLHNISTLKLCQMSLKQQSDAARYPLATQTTQLQLLWKLTATTLLVTATTSVKSVLLSCRSTLTILMRTC
jgi:hypothetical protein